MKAMLTHQHFYFSGKVRELKAYLEEISHKYVLLSEFLESKLQ